jgi:hypothetical protein
VSNDPPRHKRLQLTQIAWMGSESSLDHDAFLILDQFATRGDRQLTL